MTMTRRQALAGSAFALAAAGLPVPAWAQGTHARMRVIVDNDFSGDPDGLFQLAQHAVSPSVDIRMIVGSHLHHGPDFSPDDGHQAARSAAKAADLLARMGLAGKIPVLAGSEVGLDRIGKPERSPAVAAIIAEAMRTDVTTPLFYVAGAGLTDLALAWQAEPRIGKRLRLVWIGGGEHPGLALPPPGKAQAEYNLTIDVKAGQVVFGQSDIELWQVPRNAYRQMLVSFAELDALRRSGSLGGWLVGELEAVRGTVGKFGVDIGETYILGDSPLVTLTALQSSFEADPSSSDYVVLPTPGMADDGSYVGRPDGRPMRVYTRIDTRLTFADMMAKLSGR